MQKLGTFEWSVDGRREAVELWSKLGLGNEVMGPQGPSVAIVRKGGTIAKDTILAVDVTTARTLGLMFGAFARDGY